MKLSRHVIALSLVLLTALIIICYPPRMAENVSAEESQNLRDAHEEESTVRPAESTGSGLDVTAMLGIHVSVPSDALSKQLNLPSGCGLLVERVIDGSAAKEAGVQRLDVIRAIDDQLLVNAAQLETLIKMFGPQQKVMLHLIRGAKPMSLDATLGTKLKQAQADFDAFDFFHGHRGKTHLQDCSLCHVGLPDLANRNDSSTVDNFALFHREQSTEDLNDCSQCHARQVVPLQLPASI